jgi:hypothetical protein
MDFKIRLTNEFKFCHSEQSEESEFMDFNVIMPDSSLCLE